MAQQYTRPDLHAAIEQRFPDNTNEEITPERLRDGLHELVDSAFLPASDTQVTAQLLGRDPATGEFLVLLSPSAPAAKARYVLALAAGTGTTTLTPLPASASLASRILRLPASVAGQTLCLLDANGQPVPLQYLAQAPASIWHYVGDPTEQSISIGELDLTRNSFDTSGLNEGNLFYSGPTVEDNTVGAAFSFNKVGLDFRRNQLGENCFDNDFQFSFTDNVLGDNVNACYFDAGTQFLELGTGCERLSFYNCKGTPQQRFVVPAGTVDAVYRNNQLVNKADEDGRFDLLTPTDRAVPESSIRGAINWRYLTIGAVGQWDVEPGRSVMLINGCNMRITPDVVEGDIFGVYINPANPKTRIVLSTTSPGGIDGETAKRYTKGASIVFRYTLFPSYIDANNNTIPARYGLQTLQHSPPTALNNRGAWAASTYYLVGDVVTLNNVVYIRQVEGSDTGALDPTKWAGGGAAASGPQLVNSTVLRFDKSYTHAPISNGTFTTDTSTVQVDSEVSVILAATATDPAANGGLPAATFQLLAGAYANGAELLYTFRVGANGKIQYVINQLP
jgi:hypothetical protein